MKQLLGLLFVLLTAAGVQAQNTLYSTNFGTTGTALPTGWTKSGTASAQVGVNSTNPSTGYTGASGSLNLVDGVNAAASAGTVFVIYNNTTTPLNTTGYTSAEVRFGAYKNGYVGSVGLEWSPDNTNWTVLIGSINLSSNSVWYSYGSVPLPAGALNQANLRFRFVFTRTAASSTASTNNLFRIDDFTVTGSVGGSGGATGTVSSVGLSLPATEFAVTGSPVTTTGVLSGSWQQQTQNKVFAAPAAATGAPSFRTLTGTDIPALDMSKITTGNLPVSRLGAVTNARLLGRFTTGSGNAEEITIGPGLSLSGAGELSAPLTGWSLGGNAGTTAANFLGTTDAKALYFRTNNQNRVFIDTNGFTGIGTVTPLHRLDVTGKIRATDDIYASGTNGLVLFEGDPANYNISRVGTNIQMKSAGDMAFSAGAGPFVWRINGAEKMRIAQTGRLGINVNTPTALLHTNGTVRFENLTNNNLNRVLVTDTAGNVSWRDASTLTGAVLSFSNGLTQTGNTVRLGGSLTSSTVITSSGNDFSLNTNNTYVNGVQFNILGGSTKGFELNQYDNNSQYTGIYTDDFSNGLVLAAKGNELLKLTNAGKIQTAIYNNVTEDSVLTTDASGNLKLKYAGNSSLWSLSGNNAFNTNTGNIGIGTNNPASKLHVTGNYTQTSPSFTGTFTIDHAGNNWFRLINSGIGEFLSAGPDNVVRFGAQQVYSGIRGAWFGNTLGGNALTTTAGVQFQNLPNNDFDRLLVTDALGNVSWRDASTLGGGGTADPLWALNGADMYNLNLQNVGIGTSTPIEKLDVNGNINLTNDGTDRFIHLNNNHNGQGSRLSIKAGSGESSLLAGMGGDLSLSAGDGGAGSSYGGNVLIDGGSGFISGHILLNSVGVGNVGVNTNNPSARFHTNGSLRFEGLNNTNESRVLVTDPDGNVSWRDASTLGGSGGSGSGWGLTGNTGTNPATNFLGTTDYKPIVFKTGNLEQLRLTPSGDLFVGGNGSTVYNPLQSWSSLVAGPENSIAGSKSIVLGWNNHANNHNQYLIGAANSATEQYSGGMGINLTVMGSQSFSFGSNFVNDVPQAVMMGYGAPQLTVTSQGVGVGTTQMQSKLHVKGTNAPWWGILSVQDEANSGDQGQAFVGFMGADNNRLSYFGQSYGHFVVSNEVANGTIDLAPAGGTVVIGGGFVDNGKTFQLNGTGYIRDSLMIGTVTPTAQLHTTGSVRFENFKNTAALDSVLTTDQNGNLVFKLDGGSGSGADTNWVRNGNNLYNANSGFVGIGTSTPSRPLTVRSTTTGFVSEFSSSAGNTRININNSGNKNTGFLLSIDGGYRFSNAVHQRGGTDSVYDFTIYNEVKGKPSIFVDGSTNFVAIGDALPTAQLHTNGTVRFEAFRNNIQGDSVLTTDTAGNLKMVYMPYGAGGGGGAVYTFKNGVTQASGEVGLGGLLTDSVKIDLNSKAFSLSQATARIFTASSNGNIGIGTASPAAKLDINTGTGTSAVDALRLYKSNDAAKAWVSFAQGNGDHSFRLGQISQLDGLALYHGGADPAGTQDLVQKWDINGNTGIATAALTSQLSVGQQHGTKLSIGNAGWANTAIITTGTDTTNGDYTDLRVPGSASNSAFIRINKQGNVGIGSLAPDALYKLSVNGRIRAKGLKVQSSGWADFVFNDGYNLRPLTEVEQFIRANNHLPEMPSAGEVEKEGQDVGEVQVKLLQKIEELTLYAIDQEKRVKELEAKNKTLEEQNKKLNELRQQMDELRRLIEKK